MASVKAFAILLAVWLVGGFLVLLTKSPLIAVPHTLPHLPVALLGMAVVAILSLVYVLVMHLKTPAKGELWLWALPFWVLCYGATVYTTEMVEPAMACAKAEALDKTRYAQYAASPLKADCDTTGRMGQADDFSLNVVIGKTVLAYLSAAILQLAMMVNFRLWRGPTSMRPLPGAAKIIGLQLCYGFAANLLAVLAIIETMVLVLLKMLPLPLGEARFFLGYYVPLGLMVVMFGVFIVNYVWFFRKLRLFFRNQEVM